MLINDGKGSGRSAKVGSDNRLATESSGRSALAVKSAEGDAYITSTGVTADTLTATATGGAMLYIANTSSTVSLLIDKVVVSTDNVKCRYKELIGMALGTVADANSGKALNLNSASSKVAPVTAYAWDESNHGIGGLSGGTTTYFAYMTTGVTEVDHGGSVIIGPGSSFVVNLKNNSGGTLEAAITVKYYTATL